MITTGVVRGGVFTVAAIGSAFPSSVEWLCVARFVLGLGVGTASFVAPLYIPGRLPVRLRVQRAGCEHWRWMFAIEAVPGAALAIAMIFVPHTPRWLMQRGREDEARAVLHRVRPAADVDAELEDIKNTVRQQERSSVRRMLTSVRLRPFLIVGVVLAFLQQAVGINAVLYFGARDLKFMGLTTDTAAYEAIRSDLHHLLGAGDQEPFVEGDLRTVGSGEQVAHDVPEDAGLGPARSQRDPAA